MRNNTVGGVLSAGRAADGHRADQRYGAGGAAHQAGRHRLREERAAVVVKLSSYEYTIYGGLQGEVGVIGPDAMGDAERGTPDATWYRALVRADASQLSSNGKPLPVRPGMQGMGEIRTGERTVLSFLLRPMLRTQEAFRER
jgi:hypothetical protein